MIEFASDYLNLNGHEKIVFLSRLAHNLTNTARAVYSEDADSTKSTLIKLYSINELIHSITGHLRDLILETDKRYPDETFMNILIEKAEVDESKEYLKWAWSASRKI